MKNWLPFVLGPELAIERTPAPTCFRSRVISSSNVLLQVRLVKQAHLSDKIVKRTHRWTRHRVQYR